MTRTASAVKHSGLASANDSAGLLEDHRASLADLLARHLGGDRDAMPPEDARENELTVLRGIRILSSYRVGEGEERVWIITEADRSSTCILLPEEY